MTSRPARIEREEGAQSREGLFGERLRDLRAEDDPRWRWRTFRGHLGPRLAADLRGLTHFAPALVFVRQDLPTFLVRPVQFVGDDECFDFVVKRRGDLAVFKRAIGRMRARLDLSGDNLITMTLQAATAQCEGHAEPSATQDD